MFIPTIETVPVEDVAIVGDRREVDEAAVCRLVESIKSIGLQTPITIWSRAAHDADGVEIDGYKLIAGRHRLEAFRRLGESRIPAIIRDCDEIDAEMWEIAENLHRADLSKDERDRCIRRFAELIEKRDARDSEARAELKPSQNGTVSNLGGRGNKGTPRKVAEETGVSVNTVRRALNPPAPKPAKLADDALNDFEAKERQVSALMSAWNRAGLEARDEFLSRIDRPVMDGRFA
jgi:ParB/RepB/Spo0J family partition protein